MYRRFLPFFVVLLCLWLYPQPAFGYIPHWDPKEAFFVRQFSYLVFLFAMLFFIYELRQERLQRHPGFRFLVWASVFFALWNFDCFVGQFAALHLTAPVIPGAGGLAPQRLLMTDLNAWIYYLTKLDHLLMVPAYVFFYLGIKAFAREPR